MGLNIVVLDSGQCPYVFVSYVLTNPKLILKEGNINGSDGCRMLYFCDLVRREIFEFLKIFIVKIMCINQKRTQLHDSRVIHGS